MEKLNKFLSNNQSKFLILIGVYLLLGLFSKLPYLNVVFAPDISLLVLFLLTASLFRLKKSLYAFLALISLFFAAVATILGEDEVAEIFGNATYVFVFTFFVVGFYTYLKDIRRS